MKILVCIPHFFDRSRRLHAVMGSSQDSPDARAKVVDHCLRQMAGLLSPHRYLLGTSGGDAQTVVNDVMTAAVNPFPGDVCVLTHKDEHLLDLVGAKGYRRVAATLSDPVLLPYACRAVFAEQRDAYDLFFYVEDDIVPLDGAFFAKIAAFYDRFGHDKVVLPQRYELFGHLSAKVYLEHPSPDRYRAEADVEGAPRLTLPSFMGDVHFDLTPFWGTGCFAVTREQLAAWMRFPDFHRPRRDMGIMVMEQAMLPMLGRRPMYRPAVENLDFLEVHHVPNRACHARTPFNNIREHLEALRRAK